MTWTRRAFTRDAAALMALAACDPKVAPADGIPVARPKHVVLITADDLGWRDLGAYGLTTVATPAHDRLVAEGVAFDRAFDVTSSCSSSRASMITGQYVHTHGVMGLVHRHPEMSLPTDHPTMVRVLADAGYAAAVQGKWHIHESEDPPAFGYERWLTTDIDQVIRDLGVVRSWLDARKSGAIYLELNFMQTHRDPFGEFRQVEGHEVAEEDAAPPEFWGLPDWPEIRAEVAAYMSQLSHQDALIGELLDTLDELGLTDDTLVVFVSDNGPAFPGCKMSLYDRGTGTPLVFRWPGLTPARHDTLVSTVDIAPTLLDMVGAEPLPAAQGRSLAPLLRGASLEPLDALFSEMEFHAGAIPTRAVRTDRFKYILNLDDTPLGFGGAKSQPYIAALSELPEHDWDAPRVPEELYDLDADPLERTNLVDDPAHADTLAELRGRLADWQASTEDPRAG